MAVQPKPFFTPEQYLELERKADYKSEYLAGQIFAMAGASREHNLIATNVTRELSAQLKGRPCETYGSDMRVKVNPTGLYTYPDAVAVCGRPHFEDEHVDTLLNPTVIIEILSPSTEAYDRGEKAAHYRRLTSLKEYLLIAQDKPRVERYVRQENGSWALWEASGLSDTIHIEAIQCELPLAEVYDRIAFPVEDEARYP
jgi:Uma2 family endonuclease